MATIRQIRANRANALKSTGPKTPEGKDRSRRNALKHGLSGAGDVVPDDDRSEVEDRVKDWTDDLRPVGAVQRYLVAHAARASVRLDRCLEFEESTREANLRALDDHAERDRERAEELGDQLGQGDPAIVRQLRRFAAGRDWLIERWGWVERGLAAAEPWKRGRAGNLSLALLGLVGDDPRASALAETIQAAELTLPDGGSGADSEHLIPTPRGWKGPVDSPAGAAERAEARLRRRTEARAELSRLVALEVERLSAERADREEVERAESRRRAWFDPSPTWGLLRRYESACESGLFRSLNGLAKLKKEAPAPPDQDRPDSGPTPAEATAEPVAKPFAAPGSADRSSRPRPARVPCPRPSGHAQPGQASRRAHAQSDVGRASKIVPFKPETFASDPDLVGGFALVVRSGSKGVARPSRR